MGIPVFTSENAAAARPRIAAMRATDATFRFTIENAGDTHLVSKVVRMTARDSSGVAVVERAENGWYILARGARTYEFSLSEAACRHIASFQVTADTTAGTAAAELVSPCGARTP
jgi:hypothetical protein